MDNKIKLYPFTAVILLIIGSLTFQLVQAEVPGSNAMGVTVYQDAEDEDEEEQVAQQEESFWERLLFWRSNGASEEEEEENPFIDMSVSQLNAELFQAVRQNDPEVVAEVLQYGAEVNSRNAHRRTPLIEAARNGRTQIAEILIENGAGVNAQDMYGGSPHQYATRGGYSQIVYMLLENGAIPD